MSYHTFSSKIECTLHGTDIRLARKDPLPSGHNFTHPKFGTLKWTESSVLGSGVELFCENKAKIARFRKRLNNDKRGSGSASEDLGLEKKTKRRLMKTAMNYAPMVKTTSGFEVYVPLDEKAMNMVIVTGLAAAEYRRRSNEEWDKVIEDGVEEVFGI